MTQRVGGDGSVKWLALGLVAAGAVVVGSMAIVQSVVYGPTEAFVPEPMEVAKAPEPEPVIAAADAGTAVVEEEKEAPVDWAALASEQLVEGNVPGAVGALKEAAREAPDDLALQWKIARLDTGRNGDKALEEIIRIAPLDQEAPLELARRRIERGDAINALSAAKEAARRNAWNWEPEHIAGRAHLALGETRKANAAFRRATMKPKAPSHPFNSLGYAMLIGGEPSEAMDLLEQAVERGPVTHYMMNNLGLAYERTGRLDDAELAFVGALELKEDYVKATVNLDRVVKKKDAVIAARALEDDESWALPYIPDGDGIGLDPLEDPPEFVPGG